ncbi:hypothetical protein HK101_001606 [Irineochytrium annulatum]|nr:hypothetical protein HK101_001606 [Irineochytrium annulatum]
MFPIGSLYLFNRPEFQEKLLGGKRPISEVMGIAKEDMMSTQKVNLNLQDLPKTSTDVRDLVRSLIFDDFE